MSVTLWQEIVNLAVGNMSGLDIITERFFHKVKEGWSENTEEEYEVVDTSSRRRNVVKKTGNNPLIIAEGMKNILPRPFTFWYLKNDKAKTWKESQGRTCLGAGGSSILTVVARRSRLTVCGRSSSP